MSREAQPQRRMSRRKATLIAGAGTAGLVATLPRKWTRPIVDAVVVPLHAQGSGLGSIVYESALPGPTALVGGFGMTSELFLGVRFQIAGPVLTSQIGIHASVSGSGTIFGAVVQLSGLSDFPDSFDLSTSDVLGSALLSPPLGVSGETTAPLVLNLAAGTYALVFGSGILGATAQGFAPGVFPNVGSPSYFYGQIPLIWVDGTINQVRIFLLGS